MRKKQIRKFSAEEKTKIVLELLKEELTIAQLSTKYEVTAKTIHNWKKLCCTNSGITVIYNYQATRMVLGILIAIILFKISKDSLASYC
jgi:hypothetical protein